jgi:hypothetical protein
VNGRPMNALEYYAQMAQQQQQVPQGNPIAEYLLQREAEHMANSEALDSSGGAKKAAGLGLMLGGGAMSPFIPAVGFPAIAAGGVTKTLGWIDEYNASNERIAANEAARGSNMWEGQFGPYRGRGYPGTQSGPGRVQQTPDWLTGRAMKQPYEY